MGLFKFFNKTKDMGNNDFIHSDETESRSEENRIELESHNKQTLDETVNNQEDNKNEKHFVYNLIILDESGSMASIKQSIISGFNELVQSIKGAAQQYPEQAHFISFVSFNSSKIKTLHDCAHVAELENIDASRYNPNNCTPLYDAIGFGIEQLQKRLDSIHNYNVLVTIMTDGLENSSKKFSINQIKSLIENLKKERWTFTYIGTDHDIESVADALSISNKMRFERTEDDMREMFARERYSRQEFHRNIDRGEEYYKEDYYNEERGFSRFLKPHREFFHVALDEIRNGRKVTHWMWFMFPQIQGLGHSHQSKFFAIRDLNEANLFLCEYPTGTNLKTLSEELLNTSETNAEKIFGHVDAMKLRSCMTLFSMLSYTDPVFLAVLDKFFNGQKDQRTIEILNNQQR
jgi:uncharacterized protein (DUF1810 family)/Mg-chelatase subunit ChlD